METWDVAAIAFILLGFAAFAGRFERSVVTPAIFFTSAGLLAGPVLGLIDLQLGKRIEVEALQGSVVRRGQAAGVPTPVMATLYSVLKPHEDGTRM